jgi:farnesyl diphosphate synthase
VLDVEGDVAKTGKRLHKDADAGKATFVSLLGLDRAKARAADLIDMAEAALSLYGDRAANLIAAGRFVISRES